MKNKIILSLLIIVSVFLITGCDNKKVDSESENKANDILNTKQEENTNNDGKVLVVYFSKTGGNYNVGTVNVGNTAMMASYIKEYLNADSFEIVPVKKYSDNYKESTEEAKKEQNENARPEIKNKLENINDYETIFIGYPIWWGDMPQILYTFIEEYDLSGKTIIPFNTHEGSGSAGTYNTLKDKLKTSKFNTNGLAITGSKARTDEGKEETIKWLKELGY